MLCPTPLPVNITRLTAFISSTKYLGVDMTSPSLRSITVEDVAQLGQVHTTHSRVSRGFMARVTLLPKMRRWSLMISSSRMRWGSSPTLQ